MNIILFKDIRWDGILPEYQNSLMIKVRKRYNLWILLVFTTLLNDGWNDVIGLNFIEFLGKGVVGGWIFFDFLCPIKLIFYFWNKDS